MTTSSGKPKRSDLDEVLEQAMAMAGEVLDAVRERLKAPLPSQAELRLRFDQYADESDEARADQLHAALEQELGPEEMSRQMHFLFRRRSKQQGAPP